MRFFYKIIKAFNYLLRYLKYILISRHKWGFGIHSPFVYNFYQNILNTSKERNRLKDIKKIRKRLIKEHTLIYTTDLGTGSEKAKHRWISLKTAVKRMSIPHKYGKVLYRIIEHYSLKDILEIGTGVGVSTLYLAKGTKSKSVHTIEGDPQKAYFAKDLFKRNSLENVEVWINQFDDILFSVLKNMQHLPDFIFIDGNHRKASTIQYFETVLPFLHNNSVVVLDDIHWSKGMEEAWDEIRNYDQVTITIDLFQIGIVFFKKGLSRQNFIIRY